MIENSYNNSLFRLKGYPQYYDWGKTGSSSLVAKFLKNATGADSAVEEDKSYAELWMGTHVNGPASLWSDPSTSLHGLIESSPHHFLGPRLTTSTFTEDAKFPHSTHVPFLFKVLSISKALPLQAHPDKQLGGRLHKTDPGQFVDSNHKPEIAVAITDGFRGFVGFREAHAIVRDFENIPELEEAVGDAGLVAQFRQNPSKENLKAIFTRILSGSQETVSKAIQKLESRIERQGAAAIGGDEEQADVFRKLNQQYPGDVGAIAAPFFMNLVTLNKGESVYIGADEAHAYLEGDIIECMAVSDNVLNAAFVPPGERNTSTFVDCLTYTARPASHWKLPPKSYDKSKTSRTIAFDPPLEEFTVLWTRLEDAGERGVTKEYKYGSARDEAVGKTNDQVEPKGREILEKTAGPTIGVVTSGTVEIIEQAHNFDSLTLEAGGIVYIKPLTEVAVQTLKGEAEIWWAMCDG